MTYNNISVEYIKHPDRQASHDYWAYPGRQHIKFLHFKEALSEKLPKIKFFYDSSSSAIVYRDDDLISRGKIGYGSVSNGGSTYQYFVFSPHIKNERYSGASLGYNRSGSGSIDKAVKIALAKLRRPTFEESLKVLLHQIHSAMRKPSDDLRQKIGVYFREITGMSAYDFLMEKSDFMEDLFTMQPRTAERREILNNLMLSYADWRRTAQALQSPALFIWVRTDFGETVAESATLIPNQYRFTDTRDHVIQPYAQLSEPIRAKIAALSMLDNEQYVDGLGLHHDKKLFVLTNGGE